MVKNRKKPLNKGGVYLSKSTNTEQNFILLEKASTILDVSEKFLKRCIKVGVGNYKIQEKNIYVDIKSIKNFLSLKETADILSVSPRTIRRYTKRTEGKKLKSHQFQKDFAYQLSDIEKFIKESVYED